MKKFYIPFVAYLSLSISASAQSFTPNNIVVLQTSGTASKASSQVILREFTIGGIAGMTDTIPSTGPYPFQSAGVYGGSEGFLTTSSDGKYLVVGGYGTAATYTDITSTSSGVVPRVVGTVAPSGFYLQTGSSNAFYSGNDIRGAISDGTNFWSSGASGSTDGVDYFGPGAQIALAAGSTPIKAYGIRIFNGQIYVSTQKAGPGNTSSQLGVFAVGTGLQTTGTATVTQIINTGTATPEDFSFNPAGNICYIAINMNTATGGIQKWVKTGSTWALAYTLGTGVTNIGAYGLVVDYSVSTTPVIYATTFESTGNRVIKIVDNGSVATATTTTIVAATTGTYYKGISFAPVATGTPVVNLYLSADTASEAGMSVITVKANTNIPVTSAQTVGLSITGTGITAGDYALSNAAITIPAGATSGTATFTVVDDILGEGTEIAHLTFANPSTGITLGTHVTDTITIADNDGNNPPAIVINVAATTDYIDNSVTIAPASPFWVSGVMGDPTDPAAILGVDFTISDLETADTSLIFTVNTSNAAVVPPANVVVSGTGGARKIKITPITAGYSDITLTVNDGTDSTSYIIKYAGSLNSYTPASTFWHTGMSDGSDGIALDDNYYISGDDELDVLNVYSRNASGLPVKSFDYSALLSLPEPAKPEADIEAAARSLKNPNRLFWLGSMSNGKSPFANKPNRDRIFATDVTGTGAATNISFAGFAQLKASMLTWGDANGYALTASAAAGVDSKQTNGFAAEGMVFGPDSTTLFVGMRAPMVPVTTRDKALIVPILNFETWFNGGATTGSPTYGTPIELNLGGRAIRDITRMANGTYIIVAGSSTGTLNGAIYKWTGRVADTPVLVAHSGLDTLNLEGVMPINAGGSPSLTSLQIVIDKGDDVYYADGTAAKDFSDLSLRKFRSDVITGLNLTMPSTGIATVNNEVKGLFVYPNPAHDVVTIGFEAKVAAETFTLSITDVTGKLMTQTTNITTIGYNKYTTSTRQLAPGVYIVRLNGTSVNTSQKLVIQ